MPLRLRANHMTSSPQALCTECGQRLSEAEMGTANFEPVSNKMAVLNQQLEMLQVSKTTSYLALASSPGIPLLGSISGRLVLDTSNDN